MAGRGPAPKESHSRARDTRRRVDGQTVTIAPDDETRGPELPDTHEWPAPTLTWWETWRRSPQAQTFTDTDWSFLVDTAVLHAEFWLGDRSVAAELRLRAAKFGATPEDRARLRISFAVATKSEREAAKGKEPAKKSGGRAKKKPADPRHLLTVIQGDGA